MKYGMEKQKIRYTTVSISEELMCDIKRHISEYDYVSIADFIRLCVKEKIKSDKSDKMMGNVKAFNRMFTGVSSSGIEDKLNRILELLEKK